MLVGGRGKAGAIAEVEIVDTQTMQSTPAAPLHAPRAEHLTVMLPFGRVLVIGGMESNEVPSAELYDPATGEWTVSGSLAQARRGGMSAVALADGGVLVTGGATPAIGAPLALAELWEATSGAWRQAKPMITARTGHASMLLDDGRVMVAGGAIGAFSEIYDAHSDSWVIGPRQPPRQAEAVNVFAPGAEPSLILSRLTVWNERFETEAKPAVPGLRMWRKAAALTALPDGRFLSAGGYTGSSVTRFAEIYDPATGMSAETGQLNVARQDSRAFALPDGDVLLVGGKGAWSDSGQTADGSLPAELWDAKSGQWRLLPDLRLRSQQAAAAALLDDGHLLYPAIERGNGSAGEPATTVLMLWHRGSGEISEQGTLQRPPGDFRLLALGGGRVLLVGGSERADRNASRPAAELWDVARRSSVPITQPDGLLPRQEQSPRAPLVARLRDGRALVASGAHSAIYDPRLDRWSAQSAALPAHYKWLTLPDGRLAFIDKRLGLMPDITVLDPLDGRKLTLRTTKRQCVPDAATSASGDLMLLLTDDCVGDTPGSIELRRLGG
jgi:hypothetical protein